MSAITVRALNPVEWLGAPAVMCVLASVLFAIPARLLGLHPPEPVFALAAAFAWAIIRPSVLTPFVLLGLGLVLDLLWGGPLGLWPLCLLAAYAPTLSLRRSLAQLEFAGLWVAYGLSCALAFGLGWILTSLRAEVAVNLAAVGLQWLATILLFPVAFILIGRYEDADVRFR